MQWGSICWGVGSGFISLPVYRRCRIKVLLTQYCAIGLDRARHFWPRQ
jgi:hypothetical protein